LMAHWGWQKYKGTDSNNTGGLSNDAAYSYKDVKLGASYALPKDFTIGAYYSKLMSYSKVGYGGFADCVGANCGPYPKDLGASTATVYLQKTF